MPSIHENRNTWQDHSVWLWHDMGESWSSEFGGTEILWHSYLYPRVYNLIKNANILEIAPGTGRITQYLLKYAKDYVGYDLSEYCIKHCSEKFGKDVRFVLNDGKSFQETPDASIDLVFSWDSLVHADEDVLFSYAEESMRVLKDSGIFFVHHSNMNKGNYGDNRHWRGNLSADNLKKHIESLGGHVVLQEFIPWDDENREFSDCITVFSKNAKTSFSGINNDLFSIIRQENKRILEKYSAIKGL